MTEFSGFLIGTAAVLAALTGIAVFVRKLLLGLRRIETSLNDINGEPARAGVPARPGVLERLLNIEVSLKEQALIVQEQGKQLADIHHELHPNSGKSSRDILDRLDRAVANGAATTIIIAPKPEEPAA